MKKITEFRIDENKDKLVDKFENMINEVEN